MKLTKNNYYTVNPYLTNSKITDWLKDKNYFYRKHVLGEIVSEPTDAMIIGSATDCWLTESEEKFRKLYVPVARRNLKNPPKGHTEVSQTMFEQIEAMSRRVEDTTFYKEVKRKKFTSQKILQYDVDLGKHFKGIAGIPDWFKVDKKKKQAVIVDLKTASSIDPYKYHFHCEEYGYYRQQAMYRILLRKLYGVVKIENYHLVIGKDSDKIYSVEAFRMGDERLNEEEKLIKSTLEEIAQETEFAPKDVSFNTAIEI